MTLGDLLPCSSTQDRRYGCLVNAKAVRNDLLAKPLAVLFANRQHVSFGQLGHSVSCAACLTAFHVPVVAVFNGRAKEQVSIITAIPNITPVAYAHPFWYRAVREFVGETVCLAQRGVRRVEDAIAILVTVAMPRPAFSRPSPFDLTPKSLDWGHRPSDLPLTSHIPRVIQAPLACKWVMS